MAGCFDPKAFVSRYQLTTILNPNPLAVDKSPRAETSGHSVNLAATLLILHLEGSTVLFNMLLPFWMHCPVYTTKVVYSKC